MKEPESQGHPHDMHMQTIFGRQAPKSNTELSNLAGAVVVMMVMMIVMATVMGSVLVLMVMTVFCPG